VVFHEEGNFRITPILIKNLIMMSFLSGYSIEMSSQLLLQLLLLLLLTFESPKMPDPVMTDRTEDNILWTRLTAVTAKGVYAVINIGHLSFLFLLHASVAVLKGCCIT
jgi:hypothetical protein